MLNTEFDGRFRIESEIYKNDRAWVYRGVDSLTGKGVAIKILRPWTAAGEKLESRFAQEFKVLRTLDHPHIVKVIHTGLTPNRFHYFAMELLKGQTLAARLKEQYRLPPQRVAVYLDQIASAMDHAHARGIVHRDINPNNVMIHFDPTTGDETIKILDFGLAKIVADGQQQRDGLTAAGVSVGTPGYMSPEQAMGLPVDQLSDIYSLGVMLFTLLSGSVPYARPTDYATMVAHVSDPIPWLAERGAAGAVPSNVETVVRRTMAKEPKDRPRSATELARLFRDAVEHPIRGASSGQTMRRAATAGIDANPLTERPPIALRPSSSTATALSSPSIHWIIPVLALIGFGFVIAALYLAIR